MKFLSTIVIFATLATAAPSPEWIVTGTDVVLKKGQVKEACQKGGYVWETKKTGGGWACTGGLDYKNDCLYYEWTADPPYWSCIGGPPPPEKQGYKLV